MKLLSKSVAQSKVKQENDSLIDTNIRLRGLWGDITKRINTAKTDYEPDKLAKLKEFEVFSKDLQAKKDKLLGELEAITQEIDKKKDIYYGVITKQDALDEKVRVVAEETRKLELRKTFVEDLEDKWRQKNVDLHGA